MVTDSTSSAKSPSQPFLRYLLHPWAHPLPLPLTPSSTTTHLATLLGGRGWGVGRSRDATRTLGNNDTPKRDTRNTIREERIYRSSFSEAGHERKIIYQTKAKLGCGRKAGKQRAWEDGLWNRQNWVPALPATRCVTSLTLLTLASPFWEWSLPLLRLLLRLQELRRMKYLHSNWHLTSNSCCRHQQQQQERKRNRGGTHHN